MLTRSTEEKAHRRECPSAFRTGEAVAEALQEQGCRRQAQGQEEGECGENQGTTRYTFCKSNEAVEEEIRSLVGEEELERTLHEHHCTQKVQA